MSKAGQIIQLAILYIKNDQVTKLDNILSVMPLSKIDSEQSEILLVKLLDVAAEYGRVKCTKIILNHFEQIYLEQEKTNLLSQLFLIDRLSIETLSFIVLNDKLFTYLELMDDLIEQDSSPEIWTACSKADRIFGLQSFQIYSELKEKSGENSMIQEYAMVKMELTSAYAPVPSYVTEAKSDLQEMFLQAMRMDLENRGMTITEEMMNNLRDYLNNLSEEDLNKMFEQIGLTDLNQFTQMIENEETKLFRLYGPSHPLIDQDLTLNTVSSKYGGCRMLLCDVYDYDEEYMKDYDWFTGVCEQCHLKIRQRWYAVREPKPFGGWVGCFCSWKCVREKADPQNILLNELIDAFERKIYKIGILERNSFSLI